SDNVLAVGRVNHNVLLVLRLIALGPVHQRESSVPHYGVDVAARKGRIQRGRGERRAPAQGKEDETIGVRVTGSGGFEVIGVEEGILCGLALVGPKCLETICRSRSLRQVTESDSQQQNRKDN